MERLNALDSRLRSFVTDESGQVGTEYAVLLAMLILAALAVIQGVGSRVIGLYNDISSAVNDLLKVQGNLPHGGFGAPALCAS